MNFEKSCTFTSALLPLIGRNVRLLTLNMTKMPCKMPLMKNLILVYCLKREKEVFHVIANCVNIFFKLHFAYVIQSVAQMSKLAIAYMH